MKEEARGFGCSFVQYEGKATMIKAPGLRAVCCSVWVALPWGVVLLLLCGRGSVSVCLMLI